EPTWLPALREMGFDDGAVTGLLRTFVETVPGRLEALSRAVAERDAAGAARTAHRIKGSLMVFSVSPAIEAAELLERQAGEGHPDSLPAALASLEAAVAPLLESMRNLLAGSEPPATA